MLHLLQEPEALVFIPPVIRGKAARRDELSLDIFLVNDVPAEIAQRRLEDVEDELRSSRAAGGTAPEFRSKMLLMLRRCEVLEHLMWSPIEDELAALIEQQRLREHLEDFRSRLVNGHQHDLVVSHRSDDFDHVL